MPKKPQKTKEEKLAEDFFPVDSDDLKHTTEKQIKEAKPEAPKHSIIEKSHKNLELEKIEKIETNTLKIKKKKKNEPVKKSAKKTVVKEMNYTAPKIELKEKGYELIITEKPQAALKIAQALGNAKQYYFNKAPYYEVERNKKKIIVACAVGHLFTLKQKNSNGSKIPVFDIAWIPNYMAKKGDFTKRYYDTLLKLCKNAGSLTVATDFDIEGEVIGLNVIRYICGQKDAYRMKFSTLTKPELEKSYENKINHIDWGQAIAGETRHYLDWFYGINLSRALMNSIKSTGKFKIMSIGRVQGPALNLIVQKEREIKSFKSEIYWQVFIKVNDHKNQNQLELKYTKDIFDKFELKKFEGLNGKIIDVETKKTEDIIIPNPPFNLTTLQTEAYKFYGITPANTLKAAQSLYLGGLISYPRTSSQKLPSSINYEEILNSLAKEYKAEKLIKRKKPIEGKKSDPAHPSIYPTGNKQILTGDEEKIYDLIVRRFIALFCEDAIIDRKRISAKINDLTFSTNGSQIRKKAWMSVYLTKFKEMEIPDMEGKAEIIDTRTDQKETQPPKRYTPASIISELEKRNLGTKATRSAILETLYDRGYIKEKSIEATPLGMSLILTLEKYSPIIIDEELTRSFEKEMETIQKLKKDFESKEKIVIDKAKKTITDISKDFEKYENKIGQELIEANDELRKQQRIENTLMLCPVCKTRELLEKEQFLIQKIPKEKQKFSKKGNLIINYSKKTRRQFVACDSYPECKNTYSLPPNDTIQKTSKACEKCSFPLLMRISKGKRPWMFCFNPNCPTNKERLDSYQNKKFNDK